MNPGFSKFSKVVLSKVFVAFFMKKCPMDTFLGTGVALKIKRGVFQCLFVFLVSALLLIPNLPQKSRKLLLENIAGTLKPKHCRSKQKESNMHCKQQNMACSLHTKSKPQKAEAWNTRNRSQQRLQGKSHADLWQKVERIKTEGQVQGLAGAISGVDMTSPSPRGDWWEESLAAGGI